ncbi:type 1 glutamine amidotransferase [Clostridium sp.]|jgi:GMP synthase-like glutamine amidotransferase|uniref:type 1 glutamine amidotransferase n=1 Tax=Clostridium sp. TaxID=1506 RepID=UPI002589EC21|nr:type 1 glutamine amidotransferase [Clostridium sp.]MDF2504448.1 glutamine amidotransferase class-I [Clostridium sp.]
MRIHYLQHVPFEGPANIVNWAYKKGHMLTGTHLYNYETVPTMDQFDWLIIMGGPMNIYEEENYTWLKYEKQFIKEAIHNGKVVLGICLGAQLITDVLGGRVTKNNQCEIGWIPITFNSEALKSSLFKNFPEKFYVFQWHNDTFSALGEDAICIASSEACNHQAFTYKDHVIGFQFHMESNETSIFSLIDNCSDEMTEGIYVQNARQIKSKMRFLGTANSLMDEFLNKLEYYYLKNGVMNYDGENKIHTKNL